MHNKQAALIPPSSMPSKRPLLPKRGSLNTTKLDLRCSNLQIRGWWPPFLRFGEAVWRVGVRSRILGSGGVFVRWRRVFSRLLSPWSLWSESEVYLRVERGVLLFVFPALGFWCLHAVCSAQGRRHVRTIGSLGDDNSKAYVSGINVDGAKLSETDNGVRIMTYQESAVQVNNVVYRNISGTSATDVAIMFNCSEKYTCQGIVLENVNIKGGTASCKNVVNVKDQGTVSPQYP
ncbi:hypothetical protein HID58_014095 [Brassica napus]|uniref:Polygalacturonase n=1 Tax=Brassica napus TaxID=3708 RepID=A0ABQ8DGR8_BRANA|nr:hypothetical protein HID58_014095 [Brassica napus]